MSEKFFITLSPAKRFSSDPVPIELKQDTTYPYYLNEADNLAQKLKNLSADDLCRIMKISVALGQLNYERYQSYQHHLHQSPNIAIFCFAGDAYQSLSAHTLTPDQLKSSQDRVGIISGLYGLLRPLDAIQPYRLEMGSKPFAPETLYNVWKSLIPSFLNKHFDRHGFTYHLNCASQEYAQALDTSLLTVPSINLTFKVSQPDGTCKIIGTVAKRARGAFVRFLLVESPQSLDALKSFSWQGFQYASQYSSQSELVFIK